jgi:hypothetical protein
MGVYALLAMWDELSMKRVLVSCCVEEEAVMVVGKLLEALRLCSRSSPNDFIPKVMLSEDLVEHHLDVMGGVPVTMIIEAACLLKDSGQFNTAGPHEVNIGLCAGMAVLETTLLLGLPPEYFVVAVGVEWWINVDQVNAGIRQLLELLQVIAAVDHPGVNEGG